LALSVLIASGAGYLASGSGGPRSTIVQPSRIDTQFALIGSNDLSLYVIDSGTGVGSVQLVRLVGISAYTVGSPLVTFQWNSGTHPITTAGPGGVLWLYELGSSTPPTVWRISESSGAVLQTTIVPSLVRPLLVADATGLYIAGAGSFGGVGHGLIFHVGIGASAASTVLGTGKLLGPAEFAQSIEIEDGVVIADVCTRPLNVPGTNPCRTVRIRER
jgi:hypothetical protein